MDFLSKLYESNYFGIGLFAVISFLVVTFLIVLFFGKRDEKKRKASESELAKGQNLESAFKETSDIKPLDIGVEEHKLETPVVSPVINEIPTVDPVTPINNNPVPPVDNFSNNYSGLEDIKPVGEEVSNSYVDRPIIEPVEKVSPIINEPVVTSMSSIINEPVMEPIRINIPDDTTKAQPIIREEVKPIVTPNVVKPIIEEPVVGGTYYNPSFNQAQKKEEVSVPNIDFDAIAESISKELDELENDASVRKENSVESVRPTSNQFSSVYVRPEPVVETKTVIDLPKRVDLPTKKDNFE